MNDHRAFIYYALFPLIFKRKDVEKRKINKKKILEKEMNMPLKYEGNG